MMSQGQEILTKTTRSTVVSAVVHEKKQTVFATVNVISAITNVETVRGVALQALAVSTTVVHNRM